MLQLSASTGNTNERAESIRNVFSRNTSIVTLTHINGVTQKHKILSMIKIKGPLQCQRQLKAPKISIWGFMSINGIIYFFIFK